MIKKRLFGFGPRGPERPIHLYCYHKSGTVLLHRVFEDITRKFGWSYRECFGYHEAAPKKSDVTLFAHALVGPAVLDRNHRGIRLIRDPRDVIVSGYLYHKRTNEPWCINRDLNPSAPITFPRVPYSQEHRSEAWKASYLASLGGKSYQQNLLDRTQHDGLLFELAHYGAWTTEAMAAWNAHHPSVLDVRFEEIMADFDGSFRRIFQYLGFAPGQIHDALTLASAHDLGRKTHKELEKINHVSSAEGWNKWPAYFALTHQERFREQFPDVLERLGFEAGDGW